MPLNGYMVHRRIWERARIPTAAVLCLVCLELEIGRRLHPCDFNLSLPINEGVEDYLRQIHPTPRRG